MKKADDSFLYLKTENPQIEICLSCRKQKCTGNCENMVTPKEYIIRRDKQLLNGEVKVSYLHYITKENNVTYIRDVHKALKRTYKGALAKLNELKKLGTKGVLEVVKYEDEVEKITKENRKTYRGKPRIHVDANGNILGK